MNATDWVWCESRIADAKGVYSRGRGGEDVPRFGRVAELADAKDLGIEKWRFSAFLRVASEVGFTPYFTGYDAVLPFLCGRSIQQAFLAQKLAQQPKWHFLRFPRKNGTLLRRTHFSQKQVCLLARGAELLFLGPAQKTSAETGLANW